MKISVTYQQHSSSSSTNEKTWPQVWAGLAICYLCFSAGNFLGYTSSAIPSIRSDASDTTNSFLNIFRTNPDTDIVHTIAEDEYAPPSEFNNLTDAQASWIGGLSPFGAFVGSVLAAVPAKSLGPRGTVLKVGAPLFLISWLIIAFSSSLSGIYCGRFLGGLSIGITSVMAPVYLVETASAGMRGPLGTVPQCMLTAGILVSYILGSFLSWRQVALASALIVTPAFCFLPLIPESHVWLESKDRYEEAQRSYQFLTGSPRTASAYVKFHIGELSARSKWSPQHVRVTLVALGLMAVQQICGINVINFYAKSIFSEATNTDYGEDLSAMIVGTVLCLATVSSFFLIERLGRKRLLIVSVLFMGLAATGLGTYFHMIEDSQDSKVPWIPLALLLLFVSAYSIGYGPVCYIIVPEILPPEIRTRVTSLAVGFNWLSVCLVVSSFPSLVGWLGSGGTFLLYGALAGLGLIFTLVFVPETKGKTEEEIQAYLGWLDQDEEDDEI